MAVPYPDLLDKKLSLYMVMAHGMTSPGDRNSYVVPNNIHVFAQADREKTLVRNEDPDVTIPPFDTIRNIWKIKTDKKYSIRNL